jgi:transcriptional regulator GlxA family with amidase domain
MPNQQRTVTLVAYPEALLLDIAGPLQVFSSANKILKKKAYRINLCSMEGGGVCTDTGIELLCNTDFAGVQPHGDLIVPGGPGVNKVIEDAVFMEGIVRMARYQKRIISTCSGSIILAAMGILDGKLATCHWSRGDQVRKKFTKVNWDLDRIYTRDGNIYTSAGVSTGIDLCLSVLEEDHGRNAALEVARELVLFMQRTGNQSQYSHPLRLETAPKSRIEELCSMVISDPARSWRISDMSAIANMTSRTLHRHFVADLKESPSQFVERVRLDHARAMIDGGHRNMKRIAALSGFRTEQNLRRAFIGKLSLSPVEYRKRFGSITLPT